MRNEDWQFEADAVRDALKGIGSMLGLNAILSGCVPSASGGGYVFTQGYVLINGEVLYVPAVTAPITFDEDGNYFQVQEADVSPSGDIILENANSANIYKQRIAIIGHTGGSLPANSIAWLSAFNNRFNAKALSAIISQTLLLQKGIFFKRLPTTLSIAGGQISFDSEVGNFAQVSISNSTLNSIDLSLSGGGNAYLFALKLTGTGYLKVEHGAIICPGGRNHFFKANDIVLFMNDGGSPTATTHLLSIGDADSGWTVASSLGTGTSLTGGLELRYRKDGNYVVIDGSVTFTSGFSGLIFTLPAGYRPARFSRSIVALLSSPAQTWASCSVATNGDVSIPSAGININDTLYFQAIRIPLD